MKDMLGQWRVGYGQGQSTIVGEIATRRRGAHRTAILSAAIAVLALGGVERALAEDPPGCFLAGTSVLISPSPAGPVQHGDTVCYTACFAAPAFPSCSITEFDGHFFFPDGRTVQVVDNVSMAAGAPFLCCPGDARCNPALTAADYCYVVAHVDEVTALTPGTCPPITTGDAGRIVAYTQGSGVSLTPAGDNVAPCATANTPIPHACCEPCTGTCTEVTSVANCPFPSVFTGDRNCDEVTCTPLDCDDQTVCTDDSCDAVTGLCVHTPIPPCDDNSVCTDDRCDAVLGCVFEDNSARCNDNSVCTDDRCDPVLGCVNTDNSSRCNDNNACTDDGCDPVLGCKNNDNSARCDDGNACTDDRCDVVLGCVNTDNSSRCNDNNACTGDSCDAVLGCVNTDNSAGCDDSNACTDDRCDAVLGCVNTDNSSRCNDNNSCTDDRCDAILGCVNTDNSSACSDSNLCTDDRCDAALGCVHTDNSARCNDNNVCTDDGCDPVLGCKNNDNSSRCNDNNVCTDDKCDPVLGCKNRDNSSRCNDSNVCTSDRCDPILGCVFTANPPCDDKDPCTDDRCDSVTGCVFTDNGTCRPAICRTPGFWGTHARANPSKARSQNITQAVIDAGGGSLHVCGECISTTVPVGDASSAVEAMCVSPQGTIALQNARQLTSMALNCIVSGFGADCGGDPALSGLFDDCNSACMGLPSSRSNSQCRDAIDCFNNGGHYDPATGTCGDGGSDNCHNRPLVNDELGLNFEPPGPAGSSEDCNDAKTNKCAVLDLSCSGAKAQGEDCCRTDSCP